MPDEITLTLPRERGFFGIAHLVLGGLAVRLDLTFENLEDLQVALAELLEHGAEDDEFVTVRVRIEGGELYASVGPFRSADLRSQLEDVRGDGVSLGRVLRAVVDDVAIAERENGHWVELRKTVTGAADAA